jgi:hypothetical protein
VSWVTLNRQNPVHFLNRKEIWGFAMENLGRLTTLILAAIFLLAMLLWTLSVEKMAQTATVHCTYHASSFACSPVGKG